MKIASAERSNARRNHCTLVAALALSCLAALSPLNAQPAAAPVQEINWHAMGEAPCIWPTDETSQHMEMKIHILRSNGLGCYVALLWGEHGHNVEHRVAMDLSGLEKILPVLNSAHITTWVVLAPPSEGGNSLPYKTDYVRWMQTLAKLSVQYPSFRGVNIDDYQNGISRKTFTPQYTCTLYRTKQAINPKFQFAPTVYKLTPQFAEQFGGCIDGVWLWWTKLDTSNGLAEWLQDARKASGKRFPIYSGVYAHSTSWHRKSNPAPAVLGASLGAACQNANGALIWRIPLTEPANPLLEEAIRAAKQGRCGSR